MPRTGMEVTRLRLWLVVGEGASATTLEVAACAGGFAVNSIPMAVCQVAVGRDLKTLTQSRAHALAEQLTIKTRARLYLRAGLTFFDPGGSGAQASVWPDRDLVIFDGFTSYVGVQHAVGRAAITIHLLHWLVDLTAASAADQRVAVDNPADLTFPLLKFGEQGAGGLQGNSIVQQLITPPRIQSDFWGDGLLTFFQSLAGGKQFLDGVVSGLAASNASDEALAALARFEPVGGYVLSKPVQLKDLGDLPSLHSGIGHHLATYTVSNLINQTIWDKLVDCCGTFTLSVIPLIDKALVVPLAPGLRAPDPPTLWAWADAAHDLSSDTPRFLRGVAVYGGMRSETGAVHTGAERGDPNNLGSFFGGDTKGQILWRKAPPWATGLGIDQYTLKSSGVTGPRGAADAPGAGVAPDVLPPDKVLEKNRSVLAAYAQMMYVFEKLQHRQGSLAGKLRFDIGPGTQVKIEIVGEQFAGARQAQKPYRYGCVLEVSYNITAQPPSAGTSFRVAHLRSPDENQDSKTSLGTHPLWKPDFYGCPLIEA